jgi:hypothetical protein
MFDSAVQLTFPCPSCGGFLTLRSFKATGPCPSCKTVLDVDLSVKPNSADHSVPYLIPLDASGKKFDARRFRPVTQSPPHRA